MTGESLPIPELPYQSFFKFIDSHADIVLEPPLFDPNITRLSTWALYDTSQLIPIDSVQFKVMIDLSDDQTMYHEIQFAIGDQPVLWLGYDSGAEKFSGMIGSSSTETDVTPLDAFRIIEELSAQERNGSLRKLE